MTDPNAASSTRVRVGGPLKILLVADPPALLERMAEVVRSIPGLELVAAFPEAASVVDWFVWKPRQWHLAFIDLALPQGDGDQLVQRLMSEQRPGRVVAVVDHLWREVRERCARLGVSEMLEKGDLIAFRDMLEHAAR